MNNSHLCTPLLSWTSHLWYTYDVSLGKSKHDKSQKCHTATLSSIDRETAHMLIRFLNNRLSPHTLRNSSISQILLIYQTPSRIIEFEKGKMSKLPGATAGELQTIAVSWEWRDRHGSKEILEPVKPSALLLLYSRLVDLKMMHTHIGFLNSVSVRTLTQRIPIYSS